MEKSGGKTFKGPGDPGWTPIDPEKKAKAEAMLAEFNRKRDAVPPDRQIHLRDRFGDEDKIGTDQEDQYRADVEERKKRGEYWG
ncbi:hypothetical protein [Nocardia pseudovaccinii]|uniref:hypothetical protein n=1 Tax=Nocardia pseudovaccinii TaxID=189540 RepID=UPI000A998D55|nr:hypothetical protein [Nocardia pseudovaccinii]